MVAACSGLGPFRDRRDEALVRFIVETGCRAGQVVVMKLSDLQLAAGTALVRRGKGGKGRSAPFGPQTTRAGPVHPGPPHPPARRMRYGSATAARSSRTGGYTRRSAGARVALVLLAFIRTTCGVPRRIAGWPRAAPRVV
jgi:integrase